MNSAAATGMCGAAGGCAASPLHGYMIIWIFQLGTGSQGGGKGVAGLSSCHHAAEEQEKLLEAHREHGGKLGTVEMWHWVSLPTQTCWGLLVEKPQDRLLRVVFISL